MCKERERKGEREGCAKSWELLLILYSIPIFSIALSQDLPLSLSLYPLSFAFSFSSFYLLSLSLSLSLAESEASIPDISSLYTKFSKLTANKLSAIKGFFTKKLFRTGPKRCRVCVWVGVWVRKGDNVNPLVIGRERKRDREERERLRDGNTKEDSLK